jgi:hypothetical protein
MRLELNQDALHRLWSDPAHWTSTGLYNCVSDPRLIVSKRSRWAGWTLNIAHRSSFLVLVVLALIAVLPVVLVHEFISRRLLSLLIAIAVSAMAVVGICQFFSSRTR